MQRRLSPAERAPGLRRLGRLAAQATAFATILVLSACGGGDDPPLSAGSDIASTGSHAGATPFIAFVELSGKSLADVASTSFSIEPRPGTTSAPVHVSYTTAALARRGYFQLGGTTMTLPVFGLYAGYANRVNVEVTFTDGSRQNIAQQVVTDSYVDPAGIYDQPSILTSRTPQASLGFSFFMMKSLIGNVVVVDTDGLVRWVAPVPGIATSSTFSSNGFVVGDPASIAFSRLELDGTTTTGALVSPCYLYFHHNIDPGKSGLVAEVTTDGCGSGIDNVASVATEFAPSGAIVKEWDLAALIAGYMRSEGDDPTNFVRPGADWFHMNSTTYDPSDDSLIVSSRENFVVKIDYATGNIVWILGDPTKYWYTFPSLRKKALTLPPGALYPIGQHGTSITSDGLLMVFNDGEASLSQPAGAPVGESRTYSAVSAYSIHASSGTADEAWRFDHDQTILSGICSSAYESPEHSLLIDYADASNGATNRIVGLDPAHNVVFDFQYASPGPCKTSWNAEIIPLEHLAFE